MDISNIVTTQVLIMFVLMLIGYLSIKLRALSESTPKELSTILLNVVNPVVIFLSFQRKFEQTYLKGLLLSLALSAFAVIISVLAARLLIRQKAKGGSDETSIERFSAIYSNCGFMGIPLIQSVFGSDGVFYLSAFLAVFNIMVWTHGYLQLAGNAKKPGMLKILFSPSLIAVYLGLICFISQTSLAGFPLKTAEYISAINTPLAMIVAGGMIASANLKRSLFNRSIWKTAFIRLVFIPLVLIICFGFMHVDSTVSLTVIIVSAAPTAAVGTLMCVKLGKNFRYASEIFAFTTVASIVTIPLIVKLYALFSEVIFA